MIIEFPKQPRNSFDFAARAAAPARADLEAQVAQASPCRPTDRRQLVDAPHLAAAFAGAADATGLSLDQAAALGLERAFVRQDLAGAGALSDDEVCQLLDSAALEARPRLPLSAALAAYVRTLRLRPPLAGVASASHVAIPLRLADRARAAEPAPGCTTSELEQAVDWEVAAVIEGRTMSEWAFLHAGSTPRDG